MQTESKNLKETLQPILRVLNDLGGKFVFTDEEGNQFVLASKEVLEGEEKKEQQLTLPQAETVSRAIRKHIDPSMQEDVLERINRDIALAYAMNQELEEEVMDELAEVPESSELEEDDIQLHPRDFESNKNIPVPPRIRFEPLRGDLPPDLQD